MFRVLKNGGVSLDDPQPSNQAMERTADRCTLHFGDDFHTFTPNDARSRPPSLILVSLGLMTPASNAAPYRVRVVVDRSYGERLTTLPSHEPVWIIDTPVNTPVAHRLWRERPTANHLAGITTFKAPSESVPEVDLIAQLPTIDLHHGEYSADPPYSILEVIGCTPSDRVRAALAELGFSVASTDSDGFTASRE
jgi:hypothetical protein